MKIVVNLVLCLILSLLVSISQLHSAGSATPVSFHAIHGTSAHSDTSPALRDLPPAQDSTAPNPARHLRALKPNPQPNAAAVDPLAKRGSSPGYMPSPLTSFPGMSNTSDLYGPVPPDPNGDVGPTYYVQAVNMRLAVYRKADGALIFGPVNINTLWSGFGGDCEIRNNGDPIVLYDSLADRWLVSQFALHSNTGPFYQCIAVSTSPDPTGAYYRYAYLMPNGKMNDYPKFGVWPDAYYMTDNQFADNTPTGPYEGAGAWAFNRAQMIAGLPSADYIYFDLASVNINFGNMLPADLDGALPPPAGTPGLFAEVDSKADIGTSDALRLWQFHVDWATPQNATFGVSGQPNAVVPVAPFSYLPCLTTTYKCVPQPGVSSASSLDPLGDRLMHRLVYRNFGNHEVLLANHTIDAGSGIAGVRWYEVRDPIGAPFVYQQGTYSPDSTYRWMASIAMDREGNIGLGYSASSTSVYPSIRYTGRLASDPLGQLALGEGSIITGTGSQLTTNGRWGDYSAMSIDPSDDCTFWYTNEYYSSTSNTGWKTRIGAYKFPTCGRNVLTGVITDALTSHPISDALVTVSSSVTPLASKRTGVDGSFTLVLNAGAYTVTAASYGHLPARIYDVAVSLNATTTVGLALMPSSFNTVSGTLSDIVSRAPLSGSVKIDGSPFDPPIKEVQTTDAGTYSLSLAAGQTYTLTASALSHRSKVLTVGPLVSDLRVDFTLWHEWYLPIAYK